MSETLFSLISNSKIIDCTHVINEHTSMWPDKPIFSRCPFNNVQIPGYSCESYTFIGGTGTHIDAPRHFIDGGRTITDLQPSELLSNGVLIDVKEKCITNADYALSVEDILQ